MAGTATSEDRPILLLEELSDTEDAKRTAQILVQNLTCNICLGGIHGSVLRCSTEKCAARICADCLIQQEPRTDASGRAVSICHFCNQPTSEWREELGIMCLVQQFKGKLRCKNPECTEYVVAGQSDKIVSEVYGALYGSHKTYGHNCCWERMYCPFGMHACLVAPAAGTPDCDQQLLLPRSVYDQAADAYVDEGGKQNMIEHILKHHQKWMLPVKRVLPRNQPQFKYDDDYMSSIRWKPDISKKRQFSVMALPVAIDEDIEWPGGLEQTIMVHIEESLALSDPIPFGLLIEVGVILLGPPNLANQLACDMILATCAGKYMIDSCAVFSAYNMYTHSALARTQRGCRFGVGTASMIKAEHRDIRRDVASTSAMFQARTSVSNRGERHLQLRVRTVGARRPSGTQQAMPSITLEAGAMPPPSCPPAGNSERDKESKSA